MRTRLFALIAGAAIALPAMAGLESISNQDAVTGLREALVKGTQYAVDSLGKQDGFFGNGKVKIPLPGSLQKVEKLLHQLGMGKQADELVLTMNRAAEAAVPEAKALLVDSVRRMSIRTRRESSLAGRIPQRSFSSPQRRCRNIRNMASWISDR